MRHLRTPILQRGQMLLITILVLTVATTIALSLIGRATTDLSMSNQLEESTRAFDAAEAGIESALKSGVSAANVAVGTGVSYTVNVNTIGGASGVYQLTHKTTQGATETLWLVNHNADGSLNESPVYTTTTLPVCWSQPDAGGIKAALIISVLYKSADGSYKVARVAADPDAVARSNNFDATVTTGGCSLGYFETVLNFTPAALGITLTGASPDTLLALRIRPEYADTTLAVDGGVTGIPKQGSVIESTGTTGTGVSRKVLVYQQYRAASSIFDSVIYSQGNFGHN